MDDKSKNIRQLFSDIAPTYDTLNHLLSCGVDHHWRQILSRNSLVSPAPMVLDLCGGTGDLAGTYQKKHPQAQITIADFSRPMLLGSQKKFGNSFSLLEMDALNLGFSDNSFDVVMCAFGVRNFSNLEKGLKECYRVLKSGGELLVLEFFSEEIPVVGTLFKWYFHTLTPLIGKLISGNTQAYVYLPKSVEGFCTSEEFKTSLSETGFQDINIRRLSLGICSFIRGVK